MEDEMAEDYKLYDLDDEEMISRFLKPVIVNEDFWPDNYFNEDVDVYNRSPYLEFLFEISNFVIVKPRTEACGKTDGCGLGCWRIIGRDKLIKSKESGKILGFKKILKFCLKWKPREYKRTYVMEEYRLTNRLNWKQDHVVCKIRLLFQYEISLLLTKHFYTTSESLLEYEVLPDYGFDSSDPLKDEGCLMRLMDFGGDEEWPSYVTNEVYRLNPLMLVDPLVQVFRNCGICIFAEKTLGTSDECDGGYWRILHPERLIKTEAGEALGFKTVFKFYENEKQSSVREEDDVKVTWTIEEYRLLEEASQKKLLCIIDVHILE